MNKIYTEENYQEMIQRLFQRFPSFQKSGASAYKPGIANMEFADQLMGHPHRKYKIIHVAGTNGKGSVSNMLTSVLASSGKKVGLYTSPHILDFRERMRVVQEGQPPMLISQREVWDFVCKWQDTFDHIDMSFFEITTMMALDWFGAQQVDVVVLETGLGGRLDSTNIVSPALCVITNIGLDHCDMLGETLPEIAFEKAGIIKPNVPVVVGESHPDIDAVFERKVLYTNLPEPMFMGNRTAMMSLLVFADKVSPSLWDDRDEILAGMDLRGDYQRKNLRTVLAALDVISGPMKPLGEIGLENVKEAIMATALRTGFHGRWEKVSDDPCVICDIGHNEHGLKYNFAQLENMKREGRCSDLIIVYGSVADKDVDAVLHLMPSDATYIFTQAQGKRALPAQEACDRYLAFCAECGREVQQGRDRDVQGCRVYVEPDVRSAVAKAVAIAQNAGVSQGPSEDHRPLIYIGGSTYVVSEAMEYLAEMKS